MNIRSNRIYLSIFIDLIKSDLKRRYLGTYLGGFWAIAGPLSIIAVLLTVFNVGFRAAPVQNISFDIWMVTGLIVWFYINDAIISAGNSIIEYSFLVKKIKFPIGVIPWVKTTSTMYIHIANLLFLFFLLMYRDEGISVYWFQLPYYMLAMYLLSVAIGNLFAIFQVFVKDFNGVMQIVMQMGFWATPVLWNQAILPEKYKLFVFLNPIHYIVEGYRNTFLFDVWFFNDLISASYFWSFTFSILFLGKVLLRKTQGHFADVL